MDEEIRSLLEQVVAYASTKNPYLAEFRIEKRRVTRIELQDGALVTNNAYDYGVAVRVYHEGSFGFAYTARLNRDAVIEAFNKAFAMAKGSSAGLPKPLLMDPIDGAYVHPVRVSVEDVSLEQKVSDVIGFDKLVSREPSVKSRTIIYNDIVEEKYYASTEDRFLHEKRELVYLYASVYGQEAGTRGSAHIVLGTTKGYEIWSKYSPENEAARLLRRLRNQLTAATPRAGVFPVVLGPEALGVFVHEAFGHLAEADLVLAGSVLRGKRGEKVASDLVTIVDDPYIDDGFGTFRFDDEGVKTAKAVIVENGIHRHVMNDRLHAALIGDDPTGNARAQSFRYPPLVRMRNTYMEPRDARFEEMVEDIDFGYYLVSTGGGQTNIDGSFQVGIEEAYEIVNGELSRPVRNLAVAGNTLETLINIDMVGRDFELHYGRCGKGQLVFVSDGGPHVRVKRMTVGGRA